MCSRSPSVLLAGLIFLQSVPGHAEDGERPLFYPFDVVVGGQAAVMNDGNDLFAVVEKPVKPDDAVELAEASPLFIINAFSCKEDGTVEEAQPAGIIFAQNAKLVKLDATMDKKPLKPGTYLMNVVAHNKTSRVVFTVGGDGGVKLPDLKKIFEFLKKE